MGLWLLICLFFFTVFQAPTFALKKSYIVYMGGHAHGPEATEADFLRAKETHVELLGSFLGSNEIAKESMFYSYTRHINGFAAMLSEEDAEAISKHPKVVSVFLSKRKQLHTTRSWDFVGLAKNGKIHSRSLWRKASFGENIIIATLDSGVWPEHPSFKDHQMGPIPSRWKGICQNNTKDGVPCNRKLIGASYFNKDYEQFLRETNRSLSANEYSARDYEGHGSHTLSTLGGNFVPNASVVGVGEVDVVHLGEGTAKSGSPKAHLVAYKICWKEGCSDADIISAFDTAIHDGVDVISMSVGQNGGKPQHYFEDSISIGSFHAINKGVVVICSAGNAGSAPSTVVNFSPWIITVAASTMDREFPEHVFLGNNMSFEGASHSYNKLPGKSGKYFPLISAADATAANATAFAALRCEPGSLDISKVKGKILACLFDDNNAVEKSREVSLAGAVGMILCNDEIWADRIYPWAHYLPAIQITYADSLSVFNYINSTKYPTAYIAPVEANFNVKSAPRMAPFSSRGPNPITPEILKPDITAPGVDVIAAYSQAIGPSEKDFDNRRVLFNLMSGTSMACPHVSGVIGLLKSLHPDWSPSAIKSAIMTSARIQDNDKESLLDDKFDKATPFSYGAGHVNPNRAADPGLVYDMTPKDYVNFLCAMGYNKNSMALFLLTEPYECPKAYSLLDMNYPSITVPNLHGSVTVTRTLKNVGTPGIYHAKVYHPSGIKVTVEPSNLEFKKIGEEKTFKVTLADKSPHAARDYVFGKLTWVDSDRRHYVRTPITVKVKN